MASKFLFGKQIAPAGGGVSVEEQMLRQQGAIGQSQALSKLQEEINKESPESIVGGDIRRGLAALQQTKTDTLRDLQDRMRRQGLAGTSMGMRAERGIGQELSKYGAELQASLPERLRAERLARIDKLLSASSEAMSGAQYMPYQEAEYSQGFAPLLGGVIGGAAGAYFGKSPEAAAAGLKIGYGTGQALSGAYGRRS